MRGRFSWEIYIHLFFLCIAIVRLSSCECFNDPTKLFATAGSVPTEDFPKQLLRRNQKCKWTIDTPSDNREYRFVGQLFKGTCGKWLSVKVNQENICNSEEIENMTSDCLVSPSIIIEYKNGKSREGFSLKYKIEPCNVDETTKPLKPTPEAQVPSDITTTAASNSKSPALIEVFVPILVLLSAAIIGLVIYIKCRQKKNEDKDNISTQMTDLTTVTSQNTAQDAPGFINEGFYASIDEGVQARTTCSAAQERIQEQSNRKYYEITETSGGNFALSPMSGNDGSANGSESTVVANILYGSS